MVTVTVTVTLLGEVSPFGEVAGASAEGAVGVCQDQACLLS